MVQRAPPPAGYRPQSVRAEPPHEPEPRLGERAGDPHDHRSAVFLAEFRGEPFDWEATSLVPFEELLAGWQADDGELVAWFAGTDEDAISSDFTRNFGEEYGEFTYPLWQEILQSFNHAIQHRAELGMLLASLGRAVPDLDLLGLMAEDWAAAPG